MFTLIKRGQFRTDRKSYANNDQLKRDLEIALGHLTAGAMPAIYLDHKLTWHLSKFREFHLNADTLVIYSVNVQAREIRLFRIGKHSHLFGKIRK